MKIMLLKLQAVHTYLLLSLFNQSNGKQRRWYNGEYQYSCLYESQYIRTGNAYPSQYHQLKLISNPFIIFDRHLLMP